MNGELWRIFFIFMFLCEFCVFYEFCVFFSLFMLYICYTWYFLTFYFGYIYGKGVDKKQKAEWDLYISVYAY